LREYWCNLSLMIIVIVKLHFDLWANVFRLFNYLLDSLIKIFILFLYFIILLFNFFILKQGEILNKRLRILRRFLNFLNFCCGIIYVWQTISDIRFIIWDLRRNKWFLRLIYLLHLIMHSERLTWRLNIPYQFLSNMTFLIVFN